MSFRDEIRSRGALFALPDAALLPYVSGYHAYAAGGGPEAPVTDWFFPGWSNIRFTLEAGPWQVSFGAEGRVFDVPGASLFGPASKAIRSVAHGGFLIGAGLTPLGYARLISAPAQWNTDRVVALANEWAETETVHRALAAAGGMADVKTIFDQEISRRLKPMRPETEARILAIHALLVQDHGISVEQTAARLGLPLRSLNRITTGTFGFSPKLLLRRSRFLKSLVAALREPGRPLCETIDAAYFDQSHFIRDSHDFLGMPPQRFLESVTPLMRQSIANRERALGGPVQGLHTVKPAA